MDNLTNERKFRENTIESLARLETDMDHVKEDISNMKDDISGIKESVINIEKWMYGAKEKSKEKEKSSTRKRADIALGTSIFTALIVLGRLALEFFGN